MRSIGEAGGREFDWTQTDFRGREYELRAGGEVIARLHQRGGSLAVAETAEGRWSFERSGLLISRVSVRELETGADIAAFRYGWTGDGTLEMSWGGRFQWTAANFWRSRWEGLRADRRAAPAARSGGPPVAVGRVTLVLRARRAGKRLRRRGM